MMERMIETMMPRNNTVIMSKTIINFGKIHHNHLHYQVRAIGSHYEKLAQVSVLWVLFYGVKEDNIL